MCFATACLCSTIASIQLTLLARRKKWVSETERELQHRLLQNMRHKHYHGIFEILSLGGEEAPTWTLDFWAWQQHKQNKCICSKLQFVQQSSWN
jgi:hypothetical protein